MFETIFGIVLIIISFLYCLIVYRKEMIFLIKNKFLKMFGKLNF